MSYYDTYDAIVSSLAFWLRIGAMDGVEIDFCNGIRHTTGVKLRLATILSKSR